MKKYRVIETTFDTEEKDMFYRKGFVSFSGNV